MSSHQSPMCNEHGETVLVVVVCAGHRGPQVFQAYGSTLSKQLIYAAGLLAEWMSMGVKSPSAVWLRPTARAAWRSA